jgi:hypothetical protein
MNQRLVSDELALTAKTSGHHCDKGEAHEPTAVE